ncbi:hypothetical protein [Amycolatopsis sp. CA-230715]|uniref:hypothetical protein n=1 Tax=Amycolatopsis sp. CA-230715 TaxID=2745196 RepID=UPI001C01B745|nr:hypothetical protein [Amycolatopsis sp. CA-230715]QWF82670.1 hypothetical protein HUW46_06109 [Amycolatopsis sp. CA-230715]
MTEVPHSLPPARIEPPRTVRFSCGLWVAATVLTVPLSLAGIVVALDRSRSPGLGSLLAGLVVLLALGGWAIVQFEHGRPVARAALTGITVFCAWGLLIDLTVLASGESDGSTAAAPVVILEAARAGCMIVAAVLAFSESARRYFAAYDAAAPRAGAAAVPGWVWAAGIAVVTAQLAIGFTDNLPSHGRGWVTWATGRYAVETALQTSALLCLVPAWATVVRQFRYGRQWARVALTALGVLCAFFEVFAVVDAADPDNTDDLKVVYALLAVLQVTALVIAVVLSYLPAVNAHFRKASGAADKQS